jgi:hypothetical protein
MALPADCEIRNTADNWGGVAAIYSVSMKRCLFADNNDEGVSARFGGSARMEGCEFARNGYDADVRTDSFLYTDIPAADLSLGCTPSKTLTGGACNEENRNEFGPVLPLASVPANVTFAAADDAGFVSLQQVHLWPPHHCRSGQDLLACSARC